MTPPPTAALALLGVWAGCILWATKTTAAAQSRADDQIRMSVSEPGSDRSDGSSDGSFPASDD